MKKEYQATNYESDLTDKQWEAIKEFFPSGNKSKYISRSSVVYRKDRLPVENFRYGMEFLSPSKRERRMGQNDEASCQNNTKTSRKEEPSYALIDSQSVKTTCYGENHGYDGGKKRREENGTL